MGRRADLGQQSERAQSDARSQGPRLVHGAHPRARPIPRFANKARSIRRQSGFRPNSAAGSSPCTIRRPRSYTFVDTCFSTHHLQFAEDANHTLWTSGGGPVVGWLDTKKFDETGDAAASQGWAPLVLDTNGNGKRDEWTEPDQPADAQLDTRIAGGFYAVMPNPADGSVWGSVAFRYPGRDRALRSDARR